MHGSCLCGAVAFDVEGPLRDVVACHCTQCRKTSGHYWAATSVPMDRFRMTRDAGLAWYQSSASASRGFCRICGSTLFWKPESEDRISFSPGAMDVPLGVKTETHIFVEDAGDYYAAEGPPPPHQAVSTGLSAACLCGGVHFTLPNPQGGITACHCTQCRKLSGHYSASFDVAEHDVAYLSRATLAEFVTSGGGMRGFCTGCGSSLYFRAADSAFSVEAGAVDGPTGTTLTKHIFVADKGDYYEIGDGQPQSAGCG